MPAKRRVSKMKEQISPEAVALFRRGCEIIRCGDQDFFEEDGGYRSEYLDIIKRLDWVLLQIHPGDVGPLDVEEGDDDPDSGSELHRASIPRARQLHALLKGMRQ